jgi:hypothetical protein
MFLMGFPIACKSKGAGAFNTISMPQTPFELVYATDSKTHPGILIKGVDTEIVCSSYSVTIKGDLMGTMTVPGCGATAITFFLNFSTTNGIVQEHQQVTGTGTMHDLKSSGAGSEEHTFGIAMGTTLSLSQLATLTCV